MALTARDRLGPYEIIAQLGAGGMGEVYKARDARLGRDVALKILPSDVASDPGRRQRFEAEARAVAVLNHPNIVAIYDVAFEDRVVFIVSELVQGETLRGLLQRGPVPWRKALELSVQIADGLASAHAAHIVHRDLKPENVMLAPDGRVKILDFGLAKPMARSAPHTDTTQTVAATLPGTIVGTVAYMSPEQASGNPDLDSRSDQFSLGLIIYEMITGKRAFERPTAAEIMVAIIREDATSLPATLLGPFRWIVERCLMKEPAQRYESTRDLFLQLREVRDHASEITATSAGAVVLPKPKRTWRNGPAAVAIGLAAGFLLAAVWFEAPLAPGLYVPFATEPGIQTMPAWSPAGDRIAYSGEVNGLFQIFTRKIGSATRTQITRQDASCFYPFWSPDSTRIYYIVSRGMLDRSLWSSAVAGGGAEKVLDGVAQAALSPDGKILVVESLQPDKTFALMLSTPQGGPPKPFPQMRVSQVRTAAAWGLTFRFTPDGRHLGLLLQTRHPAEFLTIPMDGGTPQELLNGHEFAGRSPTFSWLPDKNIVWSSSNAVNGHIVRTDFHNGTDSEITIGVGREQYAALSPDNHTLAFQTANSGYDLVEVPLNGRPPFALLAGRTELAPSWAPDGIHFAYATDRSGWYEIWLRNRSDGSERMIVSTHDFPQGLKTDLLLNCTVSPDGSRVAYRYSHGTRQETWVSSLAGDARAPLAYDPQSVPLRGESWSPDGNWIATASTYNGKPAVMKIRVGADRGPELVTYATAMNPVSWSPSGDWIAWNDDGKLTLVSPDGKQRRIVSQREWFTYGWSKDGSFLYGIGLAQNRHLVVSRIEIVGERETVVTDLGPAPAILDLSLQHPDYPYRGFSLHPDGKSFLTSVLTIKGGIWLLEDFDRRLGFLDRLRQRTQ